MGGNRLFSKAHIWVLNDGQNVVLGISDYAREKLGNIMFVNLPDIGDRLTIGTCFGDIESIKTVSDLISPVNGEVVKVNEALVDEPDNINADPYESWLVEVKADAVAEDLMSEETYLICKEES